MYNYQSEISKNGDWIAKPLNKTGNLKSWIERMEDACPEPELGQVVWLNNDKNSIGYKALGFKRNGGVIWQRGQVIWH